MLETDLHCAAKVGNQEVILRFFDIEPAVVKDVLKETNEKGDTALHVAVRYNHAHFCRNLMEFDSELAYTVNKEMFSPFHIAIDEKRGLVAEQMLCVDPILACTQLTDGMFPVHLAACKNNPTLLLYFMKNFPDYVEFVDSRGRNLFHFVAEEATRESIFDVLSTEYKDILTRMNNATDYEGNTPIHIAAMKGHWDNVYSIWMDMTNCIAQTIKNNGGLTPYVVSRNQIKEIWKVCSN
jgi:ankyrin repeat protein